jgi:hypothetical protein
MHRNRAKLLPKQGAITGTPPFTGKLVKARFKDKVLTTLPATPQSKCRASTPALGVRLTCTLLRHSPSEKKGKPMRNLGSWAKVEVAN